MRTLTLSLPEKSLLSVVKEILVKGGQKTSLPSVFNSLKAEYPKVDYSENTVRQYYYSLRSDLGYATPRDSVDTDEMTGKEIIENFTKAKKLLESVKMSGPRLIKLLDSLEEFGDIAHLRKCLIAMGSIKDSEKFLQTLEKFTL
jgi:hypothetical protein